MAKQSAAQRAHTLQLSAIRKSQQVLQANSQNIPPLEPKPLKSTMKPSKLAKIQSNLDEAFENLQITESQLAAALCQNEEARAQLVSLNATVKLLEKQLELLGSERDAYATDLKVAHADLIKARNRITRLERERNNQKSSLSSEISILQNSLSIQSAESKSSIAKLNSSLNYTLSSLDNLKKRLVSTQNDRCRWKKQSHHAKASLKAMEAKYKALKTWNPAKNGYFSPKARRWSRYLKSIGVNDKKVGEAMVFAGKMLGVKVTRIMSARTVRRTVKEGGFFSKIQLGREIANAKGASI